MNNTISYYYHLYPETIIKRKKKYIFEYHQVYYIFEPITRPLNEMEEILRLNEYSSFYNSSIGLIEKNIEGKYITILNNKYYVLISNRTPNRRIYFSDLLVVKDFIPLNNFMLLKRNDWVNLWSKKNDYFEYQKEYIKTKFPTLYYSLDYYIGLSENAISYIGQVEREMKPSERDHLVLAKKRVHYNANLHEFQSPLNIVIDYKERDVSEYFKSLFLDDCYNEEEIINYLKELPASGFGMGVLMGRMLFPSFYFDLYEKIVNDVIPEKEIYKIIDKSDDYEYFLRFIYFEINKIIKIPRIDWLHKDVVYKKEAS